MIISSSIQRVATMLCKSFFFEKDVSSTLSLWSKFRIHLDLNEILTEVVGFNKVGTSSLVKLFKENGIPSVHRNKTHRRVPFELSIIMFDQYIQNKTLLSNHRISKYKFFSEFDVYIHREAHDYDVKFLNESYQFGRYKYWFQIIEEQYPNSLYILSIRPINHWLRSKFTFCWFGCPAIKLTATMPDVFPTDVHLLFGWKKLWYQYICKCLEYFIDKDITDRLIIFDIENDSFDGLLSFFEDYNIHSNGSVM